MDDIDEHMLSRVKRTLFDISDVSRMFRLSKRSYRSFVLFHTVGYYSWME